MTTKRHDLTVRDGTVKVDVRSLIETRDADSINLYRHNGTVKVRETKTVHTESGRPHLTRESSPLDNST